MQPVAAVGEVESVGSGLDRALYATYLSYLSPEQFAYPLTRHDDQRGTFTEFLRTRDSGQVAVLKAFPGQTRGEHYHHTKAEKMLVVQGEARFRFRQVDTGETLELTASSGEPVTIETIPGWAHDITNTGDDGFDRPASGLARTSTGRGPTPWRADHDRNRASRS